MLVYMSALKVLLLYAHALHYGQSVDCKSVKWLTETVSFAAATRRIMSNHLTVIRTVIEVHVP